jgi:hypothetical protein
MGSNTVQDLFNAYLGEEPSPGLASTCAFGLTAAQVEAATYFYKPLHDNNCLSAGNGTDNRVYSWDALSPFRGAVDCVSSKAGFASMARAHGSDNGKTGASDAISGTLWGTTAATCGSTYTSNPQGELEFTTSANGASGTCTPVSTGTVNPVDRYTTAQLTSIFAGTPSAPVVIGGLTVVPWMPQSGLFARKIGDAGVPPRWHPRR